MSEINSSLAEAKAQSPFVQIELQQLNDLGDLLTVKEDAFLGHINLRGSVANKAFLSAVKTVLGTALPIENNAAVKYDELIVLWYGPDEWLIVTPRNQVAPLIDRLTSALQGIFSAVTNVSGGNTVIEISGSAATDLLLKGSTLDFHPSVFGVGQCAQTLLAKTVVAIYPIHHSSGERALSLDARNPNEQDTIELGYRIIVRRSFADYLGIWLLNAAREFTYPTLLNQ